MPDFYPAVLFQSFVSIPRFPLLDTVKRGFTPLASKLQIAHNTDTEVQSAQKAQSQRTVSESTLRSENLQKVCPGYRRLHSMHPLYSSALTVIGSSLKP